MNHNDYFYDINIHQGYLRYTMDMIYIYIWVTYNDLTATSLEIMVNKGNHQDSEIL